MANDTPYMYHLGMDGAYTLLNRNHVEQLIERLNNHDS
jgi:hypothetical protein